MPGYGFSGKPTSTGWDPDRIGPGLGRADEAPRLHAVRGAGRRLGRDRHRPHGRAGTAGTARHPLQHAGHCSTRRLQGARVERARGRRPAAVRSVRRGEARVRPAELRLHEGHRLRAWRWGCARRRCTGLADSPVALAAWMLDHDARSYEDISHAFVDGQARRQPHPRRGPRQHHAHLVDEHRGLVGPALLGEQVRVLRRQGRHRSGGRERLSQTSSTRHRGAGPSARTPTSSTSTRSTRAITSRPGRSRSSSPTRSAPASGRCGR